MKAVLEFDLDEVTEEVRQRALVYWYELAASQLQTSRAAYLKGIRTRHDGAGRITFFLEGELANAVEGGMDAFDMKQYLQRYGNRAKDGHYYKAFRFSRGAPGGRIPFGYAEGKAFGAEAGRNTWAIVRGVSRDLLYENRRGLTFKLPGRPQTLLKPHHKVNIYEGLRRAAPDVAGFENFRTMSDVSEGWKHPGVEARNLLTIVEDAIPQIFATVLAG